MIVNNLNIDNINYNWKIDNENKWEHSIKYNAEINKYEFENYFVYIDRETICVIIKTVKQTFTLSSWQNCD